MMRRTARAHGFTLVELIIVLVIAAVIATSLAVFLKPAIDAYVGSRVRADLSDQADTALRRIVRDVRRAVPNSVRVPNAQCVEVVPTTTGGRYRMAADSVNDVGCSTCSAPLDVSQPTTVFDVLTPMSTTPVVGDFVVINNQNGNDVYEGNNRSAITAFSTLAATLSGAVTLQGRHRITVSSKQFSPGYDGGRFQIVSNSEQSVFYICSGASGVDANGDGTGTLYRLVRAFNATYPSSCPATSGATVLATRLKSCTFVYNPNQGATQQSGFLWMELAMSRNSEQAHMAVGAHVMNVP